MKESRKCFLCNQHNEHNYPGYLLKDEKTQEVKFICDKCAEENLEPAPN